MHHIIPQMHIGIVVFMHLCVLFGVYMIGGRWEEGSGDIGVSRDEIEGMFSQAITSKTPFNN